MRCNILEKVSCLQLYCNKKFRGYTNIISNELAFSFMYDKQSLSLAQRFSEDNMA